MISEAPKVTYHKALSLSLDIALAMEYLHRVEGVRFNVRLHVVHRDLKPGNVVLYAFLRAKITDFGLAIIKSATMTSIRCTEVN